MTGHSSQTNNMKNLRNESGQVLLIAVMLMAVLMTVVFSASFVSRTDTQISKLEEENQKALAAAEAGIEATLKNGAVADLSTLNVPSGFTGSTTVQSVTSRYFTTPTIKKGGQYTFYLSTPGGSVDNPDFGTLTTPEYNSQPLTICSGSNDFAMSIALLKSDGKITRFAINPDNDNNIITSGTAANNNGNCPTGQTFAYQHRLSSDNVGGSNLLLFVKLIGTDSVPSSGAKIGIGSAGADSPLPIQGKTIVSQAKSPTGATKTIQLFQSYPQIPAEFFVTSF